MYLTPPPLAREGDKGGGFSNIKGVRFDRSMTNQESTEPMSPITNLNLFVPVPDAQKRILF